MVTRIKLVLEQGEYSALLKAAIAELRNPEDQARFIIRKELERDGLLKPIEQQPAANQEVKAGGNYHITLSAWAKYTDTELPRAICLAACLACWAETPDTDGESET